MEENKGVILHKATKNYHYQQSELHFLTGKQELYKTSTIVDNGFIRCFLTV